MATIEFTYREQTITYREDQDDWFWAQEGRGYSKPEGARKAIDRMNGDSEPGKPKFVKRAALMSSGYGDSEIKECTVTGKADRSYGSGDHYWVTCNKQRSKQGDSYLFADTPENRAIALELSELSAKIEALHTLRDKAKKKLQPFKAWLAQQEAQEQQK